MSKEDIFRAVLSTDPEEALAALAQAAREGPPPPGRRGPPAVYDGPHRGCRG
jgi:hypothetical protein